MISLRNAASAAKGELYQLDSIELDKCEVKDKTFTKTEKDAQGKEVQKQVAYKVLIVNKQEYSIKERQLNQIKEVLIQKPACNKIKFMKLDDGKIICLPID